jgi:Barstar (barnase inhibitor)
MSNSKVFDLSLELAEDGVIAKILRSSKMKTLDGVFDEFAAAFQFPYYFGENYAAFDECLSDLPWTPRCAYAVMIIQAEQFLEDDPVELATTLRTLSNVAHNLSLPIQDGAQWDRAAIPFHVLFFSDSDKQHYEFSVRLPLGWPMRELTDVEISSPMTSGRCGTMAQVNRENRIVAMVAQAAFGSFTTAVKGLSVEIDANDLCLHFLLRAESPEDLNELEEGFDVEIHSLTDGSDAEDIRVRWTIDYETEVGPHYHLPGRPIFMVNDVSGAT